jgi:peptide/nickel transport system substrate-binding protein
MATSNYWSRYWRERRSSRRRFIGSASALGAGAAGLALVGCGGDDDDDSNDGATPAAGNGSPAASATQGTGSQPTQSSDTPQPGGILRTVGGPIGAMLDIHRTNTPYISAGLWHYCANMLIRFNAYEPNVGMPEPDLAVDLPETPEETRLIFKLHPNAKWHDKAPVNGRNVTAEDVKATFDRIRNPEVLSPRAGTFASVDQVNVIDDTTVEFVLSQPDADLLNAMADQYNLIIPKEIADRGKDAIQTLDDVIGSGPYVPEAFAAGERISVRKRPDGYWKENVAWMDGWDMTQVVDPQQQVNALRAGQADSVAIPVDLAIGFENDPDYYITSAPNPTRECLLIHHGKPPFDNPQVRQALWRAIDRQQVYDQVFGEGGGKPGGAMTPAAVAWVLPEDELSQMPGFRDRDTELKEAKDLLSAAGFPDGFDTSILTATAFDVDKTTEVLVANLREIGVNASIENVGTDFAVFLGREVEGSYELAGTLFLSGPYPDAQLYAYHHSVNGSRNYGHYSNPDMDRMLDEQSAIYDYEERLAKVNDIERELINNPGPGWIGSRIGFSVISTRVVGAVATPFLASYDDAENVWLRQ